MSVYPPDTSWKPPIRTADSGGHLALWVFWAQGGSQETNAWEVPGTLEAVLGAPSALSISLPSPPAPHCGPALKTQSESSEPGVGTQAAS